MQTSPTRRSAEVVIGPQDDGALTDRAVGCVLVGLDVRLGVARCLERELGPRDTPPELLVRLLERGHLGRKSGRGFNDWTEEDQT